MVLCLLSWQHSCACSWAGGLALLSCRCDRSGDAYMVASWRLLAGAPSAHVELVPDLDRLNAGQLHSACCRGALLCTAGQLLGLHAVSWHALRTMCALTCRRYGNIDATDVACSLNNHADLKDIDVNGIAR